MQLIYRTKDGKEFDNQTAAMAHEATLLDIEKLKLEVNELLSQILLKLKDIPAATVSYNDYNYEIKNENQLLDVKLSCIKGAVEILTSGFEYETIQLITNYYSSSANC